MLTCHILSCFTNYCMGCAPLLCDEKNVLFSYQRMHSHTTGRNVGSNEFKRYAELLRSSCATTATSEAPGPCPQTHSGALLALLALRLSTKFHIATKRPAQKPRYVSRPPTSLARGTRSASPTRTGTAGTRSSVALWWARLLRRQSAGRS